MSNYIIQNMRKYDNYEQLLKSFDNPYLDYFDKEKRDISFSDLYKYQYLLIVGEPGFGKTRLLKEVLLKAETNKNVYFIDAKKVQNSIIDTLQKCKIVESIESEEALQKMSLFSNVKEVILNENSIICLDALDEISFSKLYSFFEMVNEFIEKHPDINLFLSCRTHHLNKVNYDLTKLPFKYVSLSGFSQSQVFDYLSNSLTEAQVQEVREKTKLTELFSFISIPRYLYYFVALISTKNVEDVITLTRSELFENFIYRKLDDERKKDLTINHAKYDVIKRVLEKIAFVMKINQVSQISKDELFTTFDSLDSNFSHIVFREDLIEIFYEKSIIKDNIDFIEFENQEFLDYLGAKELCRFEKADQVFFDLAVEPHLKEVFTSWFYVLPFVLEQNQYMVDIVLEFLEKKSSEALREKYFEVLTSIEAKQLNTEQKNKIFNIVFNYYNENNKWISHIENIVYFYIEELHNSKIIQSIDENVYSSNHLFIRRNNAVDLIEHLAKYDKLQPGQITFWKEKFLEWLNFDHKEHRILHGNIVHCLSYLVKDDLDYLKSIGFIFENGIEVQYTFAKACFVANAEDPYSIDIYFDAYEKYKKNKITRSLTTQSSIDYIFELKSQEAIIYMLKEFTGENIKNYLHQLHERKYGERYKKDYDKLLNNIDPVVNDEIILLLKKLVVYLLEERYVRYNPEHRYLFVVLIAYLIQNNEKYLFELLEKIHELFIAEKIFFLDFEQLVEDKLFKYINDKNFENVYSILKKFKTNNRTIDFLMYRLYSKDNIDENIKEKISHDYKDFIESREKDIEKHLLKEERDRKNRQLGLCRQWKHKIEPEPEKYYTDLFSFFTGNKQTLLECIDYETDRNKTIEVAKNVLKNFNPLNGKVEQKGSGATVWGIHYFNECIELLYTEDVDISDEQTIIDNIFRYLPFDINSDYEMTLKMAQFPSKEAITDIVNVYAGEREDDLGTYHPSNFIEFYKLTHLKEAEMHLLNMLENSKVESYIKENIIDVLPKSILTQEWIENYIQKNGVDDPLYEKMLIALIQKFSNYNALEKVFEILILTAKTYKAPEDDRGYLGSSLDERRNPLIYAVSNIEYPIDKDKELLLLASELRGKGKDENAQFLQEIVFRHLQFLKQNNSFEPIIKIEHFLQKHQDDIHLKWFGYKLAELKEIYLEELSKPSSILESIKKYNELKEKNYLPIKSSSHLLEIIKQGIDRDIRIWIEDEGAYKYINELSQKRNRKTSEDFIQKTIKSQIELSLIKRGLRSSDIHIKREEQLLDDKRVDFTISYGFIGSILIELKLAHNNEAKTGETGKEYVKKLQSYIKGSSANHGIFLVFNIRSSEEKFTEQIQRLTTLYESEENISVLGIDCKV